MQTVGSSTVTGVNVSKLCGLHDGTVLVKVYDWASYLEQFVKEVQSTKCCKQPLHDECLRHWIVQQQINTKKELNCPCCRQPMSDLPLQADETWKKDDYFVTQLKKVWGEIPFWQHNGQYWGRLTLEQTRYGYEKHQVFRRIRMYLSFM